MSEISLQNLRKTYGKTEVIHGVSLEVGRGEFLVLLGPSGCGKSTLLRMVAGLERITSGDISIGGVVVNALEPRERGCAMVFQNYALYPHMTVAENIGYSLRVAGVGKSKRQDKIAAVAKSLGIAELLDRKPGQLSGGQRQRVAMGRAMIREPKVFLYDEPLSNLDARLRVAMRVEIRRLHQRLGTTTLFVTHDQVEAMTLADRIVVMNKGTIEQVGTPQEIYRTPASTFVASFVGTPGLNLLQGVADSSRSCVVLPDGQELAYEAKQWSGATSGPVIAGFRAEAMTPCRPGQGLRMQFAFTEELGASRLVHGTIGSETLAATVVQSDVAGTGELHFRIAPGDVHLFDAQTQRRLQCALPHEAPAAKLQRAAKQKSAGRRAAFKNVSHHDALTD